jgi:uncharacterized membrane protein YhfC
MVTVPGLSVVFMGVSALVGLALPILLFLLFRKKYRADVAPFFVGCAVFIIFALILEGILNRLILSSAVGKTIQGNIWLYGAFGGFMAGLFEETGRYAAFKTVLKKKLGNDRNALMYGAGHGGIEAVVLLTLSMISNISLAMMLNMGMADKLTAQVTDPAALAQLNNSFAALAQTAPTVFLAGAVERISAVALHLSFSVLVWFAAKDKKLFWLYPLAFALHAAVDLFAVVMAQGMKNAWVIEGVLLALAACCALVAALVWKKHASPMGP